uniref:Uncharacterized protein n=1 Tax=Knipowitschia caucasica TaxID=637954 RepID=A0AAV2JCW5_KNICA
MYVFTSPTCGDGRCTGPISPSGLGGVAGAPGIVVRGSGLFPVTLGVCTSVMMWTSPLSLWDSSPLIVGPSAGAAFPWGTPSLSPILILMVIDLPQTVAPPTVRGPIPLGVGPLWTAAGVW